MVKVISTILIVALIIIGLVYLLKGFNKNTYKQPSFNMTCEEALNNQNLCKKEAITVFQAIGCGTNFSGLISAKCK